MWPKDWPSGVLFLIPSKNERAGKPPLLARMIGRGKNRKPQVLYVLLKSVRIPAKRYTDLALAQSSEMLADHARKLLQAELDKVTARSNVRRP